MILPDVNILVQAFRADASGHRVCRDFLGEAVNAETRYGMAPHVLSGVIRICTHPRVFAQPSAIHEVIEFCEVLLHQPHCVVIQPGPRHWEIFARLCVEADARGNLAPDAWLAALAIESGCEWITLDRDYARFPGLKWRIL